MLNTLGTWYDGLYDGWYGSSRKKSACENAEENFQQMLEILENLSSTYRILKKIKIPKLDDIKKMWKSAEVTCGPKLSNETCQPSKAACLFNIKNDPCEYYNLADQDPLTLKMLQERLNSYNRTAVPPRNRPFEPRSNPKYFDNIWTNWGDYI